MAGNADAARDSVQWVVRDQLDAGDAARLNLVLADLALKDDRPEEAESLLAGVEAALPAAWRERYAGLSTRVQDALSGPGSRDLSRAQALSDSLDHYEPEAALELLRSLERIPSGDLAARADSPRSDRKLTGWLDLALETPLLDTDHARRRLGWTPRHSARDALLELVDGMRRGSSAATPPLSASTRESSQIRKLRTGTGRR